MIMNAQEWIDWLNRNADDTGSAFCNRIPNHITGHQLPSSANRNRKIPAIPAIGSYKDSYRNNFFSAGERTLKPKKIFSQYTPTERSIAGITGIVRKNGIRILKGGTEFWRPGLN